MTGFCIYVEFLKNKILHFSCSVNRVEAHEGLWLASLYLLRTNRLSETPYTQTARLHTLIHTHTHSHKQQCMAALWGLFTLSRRPSVRQRNEWLFILEGWFNELDPQLLCVSTRHIQTRPSPFLTPPYPLHKVRGGDTLIASFGTGESGRPTAPL